MQVDKKTTDDGLRFILINDIGEAELVTDVDEDKLRETLAARESLAEN
jgi:3-dehydroquinate synthetase